MAIRTIRVANAADLATQIRYATGGETFSLAPGDYGTFKLGGKNFAAGLTFKSTYVNNQAVFDGLSVDNSTNIRFINVTVEHLLKAGETTHEPGIEIQDSRRVSLIGLKVHGSLDGNPGNDGFGMQVTGSESVLVHNSSFAELRVAGFIRSSEGVVISQNRVDTVREGFDFQQVEHVLVERNRFTDFFSQAGDHADAIQFWTTSTSGPSRDVTIRGNVMLQGAGESYHGLLVRNEADIGRHSEFVVENNAYFGSSLHGISLYDVDNARVENNSVLSANPAQRSGINLFGSNDIRLIDNIADVFTQTATSRVTSIDNIDYHPAGTRDATHLDSLFVTAPNGAVATIDSFALRTGSQADVLDAGFDVGLAKLTATAQHYQTLLIGIEAGANLYIA